MGYCALGLKCQPDEHANIDAAGTCVHQDSKAKLGAYCNGGHRGEEGRPDCEEGLTCVEMRPWGGPCICKIKESRDQCKEEGEYCGSKPFPPFTIFGTCCEGKMCKFHGLGGVGKCAVKDTCKEEGEYCGSPPFPSDIDFGTCCEGKMCKQLGGVGGYTKCVVEGSEGGALNSFRGRTVGSGLAKICNEAETKKYLGNLNVGIEPIPVKLKGGEKIKVSFDADVLKAIPVGSKAKVEMTKDGSPLPCVDAGKMLGLPVEFNVGSCEYDPDVLLNAMEKLGFGSHCSPYDCKLPIPAGKYGSKDFPISLPDEIPPFFAALMQGKLAAHVSVKADGKEIICADVSIDVTAE